MVPAAAYIMKFLFTHQNFPGQYLHLARHLGAQPSSEVAVPHPAKGRCAAWSQKARVCPEAKALPADLTITCEKLKPEY